MSAFAAVALLADLSASPTSAAEFTLRAAHDQPKTGFMKILFQKLKELVEERTNGRVEVKVSCCAQLGDNVQAVESMRVGTIDISGPSVGNLGPHIPKATLLGVPYIIENKKHLDRLVDENGKFFGALSKAVGESGDFRALGIFTAGVRSVYNSKRPIHTPDDLKGIKIRVLTSDVQVNSWNALGASPTSLPFAEVYTALLTGVVDAAENSPMFLWNMKHYEGVKYYSLTSHMVATGIVIMSETTYQKLPPDLRSIVVKAGAEATAVARAYDEEANKEFMKKVVNAGIKVNEVDTAPLVAKTRHLHDQFAKKLGAEDLLKSIREEAIAVK